MLGSQCVWPPNRNKLALFYFSFASFLPKQSLTANLPGPLFFSMKQKKKKKKIKDIINSLCTIIKAEYILFGIHLHGFIFHYLLIGHNWEFIISINNS